MRALSIIIDDGNLKKLKNMSKKLDRSVSWLVRQALKKYLPKNKKH
ncbi:MAG: ribbon-helix-helix protein, CopG family [archaeon]